LIPEVTKKYSGIVFKREHFHPWEWVQYFVSKRVAPITQ